MKTNWQKVKLEDVAGELTVGYVSSMTHAYQEKGVPFLRSQNVVPFNLDFKDIKYIPSEFHEKLKKSQLLAGDVVIVRTGKPGTSAVIPSGFKALNCSDLLIVRPSEKIDPHFLCYHINGLATHHIDSHTVGAVQQHFNVGAAKKMPILLPPMNEQKKIVKILRDLDQKLNINKKTNELLEKIVQSIFKSWFVDLDPVHAKKLALEKGLTSAQVERAAMAIISGVCSPTDLAENFEGMDKKLTFKLSKLSKEKQDELAHTASFFPSKLEASELGEIPKGWHKLTLGDIALNIRETKKPNELTEDDIYIGLEHIDRKNIFLSNWNSGDIVESNKSAFNEGDILFGKLRPYFHKVCTTPFSGVCSTDILVIREKEFKYKCLTLSIVNQEEFVEYANTRSTGTRMPRASWKDMAEYKVIIPCDELLAKFESLASTIVKKGNYNVKENLSLEKLRETLLPKLLSGEIDLSGVSID